MCHSRNKRRAGEQQAGSKALCFLFLSYPSTRNSFCIGTPDYHQFEVFHDMYNIEIYVQNKCEWFYALCETSPVLSNFACFISSTRTRHKDVGHKLLS
jgi:hypothetical protein